VKGFEHYILFALTDVSKSSKSLAPGPDGFFFFFPEMLGGGQEGYDGSI
jgi:hypothetical protein